jgi:hypothetical protein
MCCISYSICIIAGIWGAVMSTDTFSFFVRIVIPPRSSRFFRIPVICAAIVDYAVETNLNHFGNNYPNTIIGNLSHQIQRPESDET